MTRYPFGRKVIPKKTLKAKYYRSTVTRATIYSVAIIMLLTALTVVFTSMTIISLGGN
jgi:hypothetical protein